MPTKIRRAKTSRLNEHVYTGYAAANLNFSQEIKFAFKIAKFYAQIRRFAEISNAKKI
jgi:hypothetical protein